MKYERGTPHLRVLRMPDACPAAAALLAASLAAAAAPAQAGERARADPMHALERALVREGGLTLPAWQAEVAAQIEYRYAESNGLTVVDLGTAGATFGEEARRRHAGEGAISARLGLPWRAQAEVYLAYLAERESLVSGGATRSTSDTGLDSARVTLTKQLLAEKGSIPGLLGSVSYRKALGPKGLDSRDGLRIHGAGFDAAEFAVTAVRSQDPLVFYATGSYARTFTDDVGGRKIRPGDVVGAKAGTILAVTPDTSLRFGLNAAYAMEAEVDGTSVPGSDSFSATLEFGLSTILSERTLMSVTGGAGLTDAAPDLRVSVSFSRGF